MNSSDAVRSYTIHLVLSPPDSTAGPGSSNISPTTPIVPATANSALPGAPNGSEGSPRAQEQVSQWNSYVAQALLQHNHLAQAQLGRNPAQNPVNLNDMFQRQLNVLQQQMQQQRQQQPGMGRPATVTTLPHGPREQETAQGAAALSNASGPLPTLTRTSTTGNAAPNFANSPQVTSFTQDAVGPNGVRMRVTVNQSMTINHVVEGSEISQPSASNPNMPYSFTAPAQHHQGRVPQRAVVHRTIPPQPVRQNTESGPFYLLSSPNGPQAILMPPQNTAVAGTQFVPGAAFVVHRQQQPLWRHLLPTPATDTARANTGVHEPRPAAEAPLQNPAQDAPAAPAGNPDRDFALSIIRRLWLFLRLYIFAFLFSEAGSWRRWSLLCIGALIAVLSETETVHRLRRIIWEPIMRHLEGVVPLAGNDPRHRDPNPIQGQNAVQPQDAGTNRVPDPGQLAQRLLRERNERDLNSFRQFLHWLERAVALFIASLVPGVGERHIRARNETAARLATEEARAREAAESENNGDNVEAGQNSAEGGASAQQAAHSTQEAAGEVSGESGLDGAGTSEEAERHDGDGARPPSIEA